MRRLFLALLGGSVLLAASISQAQPILEIRPLPARVDLIFSGTKGTTNQLQWASVLGVTSNWTTLTNIILTSNRLVTISDVRTTNLTKRFYRLRTTGLPPTNPHPDELTWIYAGSFTMGSPSNEVNRLSREGPQRQVTISRGFWMGKREVTQEGYAAVTGAFPSHNFGFNLPVDSVSWFDATNYCGRRTAQELAAGTLPSGFVYRLPTEAEWEYAARAGTTTRFSHGDDPGYTNLPNYAWFGEEFVAGNHYGGLKLPNAWDLYDMYGNVYEWCLDWYANPYSGGSVTDPQGPLTGTRRVLRSGSTVSEARDLRSAYRDYYEPEIVFGNAGLRVVLAPAP